jgi:heme-degrading monooxygenase HmoA
VIVVIFESEPLPGRTQAYLDAAARLRPLLAAVDGFISIERYESLSTPGRVLSISYWRDADAVRRWRNETAHREVQRLARASIFADYRLYVAEVMRSYSMHDRAQAPDDSKASHGRSPAAPART